jgi:hypothetical protein
LDALKAANLAVDAVEFGIEDDSYPYDADVSEDHKATPEEIKTWLHGYGQFLKTGAEILPNPSYFPQAKIITFGIAHGCDACDVSHLSSPARFVAMLKKVDGHNYLDNSSYHVDGYGTHLYPSPNDIKNSVTSMLEQDVAALGRDRPIWDLGRRKADSCELELIMRGWLKSKRVRGGLRSGLPS